MNIRHKKPILILLTLAFVVIWYAIAGAQDDKASVAFLDIGQGDSILITLPQNRQILIDGGPDDEVLERLSRYMPFYDRKVELIILTHPHADHLRGVIEVLKKYEVEKVLVTGVSHDSNTYRAYFSDVLTKEGAQIYSAVAGDEIMVGETVVGVVLSPEESQLGLTSNDVNQTSVVIKLSIGGETFLLMGDAETEIEKSLLAKGALEDIDVLKVGHQGSKGATSPEFLAAIRPEIAVISVGQNNYGHPSPEVIERLENAGVVVRRTDKEGDIVWRFE